MKKLLILTLAVLLINLHSLTPVAAGAQSQDEDAKRTAKVKAKIAKLDIERDTRVEVKLLDNTKVKGYLSAVGENGFSITNTKTNLPTTVAYDQVKELRSYHQDWRTGTPGIILGIGVGIAVILASFFARGA